MSDAIELMKQLEKHPELAKKLKILMNRIDNPINYSVKADDIEEFFVEHTRELNNELFQAWADNLNGYLERITKKTNPSLKTHSKKNFIG